MKLENNFEMLIKIFLHIFLITSEVYPQYTELSSLHLHQIIVCSVGSSEFEFSTTQATQAVVKLVCGCFTHYFIQGLVSC